MNGTIPEYSVDLAHKYITRPYWEPYVLFFSIAICSLSIFGNVFLFIYAVRSKRKLPGNTFVMSTWAVTIYGAMIGFLAARYDDYYVRKLRTPYECSSDAMFIVPLILHFAMVQYLILSMLEVIQQGKLTSKRNWKAIQIVTTVLFALFIILTRLVAFAVYSKYPASVRTVSAASVFVSLLAVFAMIIWFIVVSRGVLHMIQGSQMTSEEKVRTSGRFRVLERIFICAFLLETIYYILNIEDLPAGDPALIYPLFILPIYVATAATAQYFSPLQNTAAKHGPASFSMREDSIQTHETV